MDASEIAKLNKEKVEFNNVPVKKGEMTPLERFNKIMDFSRPDRIIDCEFGYWNDTLKRWHSEGLPKYIDNNEKADIYFGFDVWKKSIPTNTLLNPPFKRRIIDENERYQIILDEDNIKCKIFKDGTDTIPHYIDFPIKDRNSYLPFKKRLKKDIKKRILVDLEDTAKRVKNRNYVLSIHAGSTAGMLRNWMGFENVCINIFDKPELMDEILNDLSDVSCAIAKEITKYIKVDLVSWWEDIAFKNGPIVTPDFFNIKCGSAIKKVMDVYRKSGTKYAFVDCDGDFRQLMPGWLENGVNIMFPLEVAAGIHPEELRKELPSIRMMGGVDKMVLLKGKDEIKKELHRLKPIADDGGFIPHIDHRVQADVPFKDYLYYLDVKRDLFGIPNKIIKHTENF